MYIGAKKKRRKRAFFLTVAAAAVVALLLLAFFLFAGVPFLGEQENFSSITAGPRQGVYTYTDERARVVEVVVPVGDQDFWVISDDEIRLHLFAAADHFDQQHLDQNVSVEHQNDRVVLSVKSQLPLHAVRVLKGIGGYRVEMFRSGLEGKRIAIDPGHGGHDPGAIYPRGTRNPEIAEKDIVLAVSLELRDMLEEAGAVVFMTRETDTLVDTTVEPGRNIGPDLWKRREIVDEWFPDFFISVHVNSFSSSTAHGLETFYNPNSFNSPAGLSASRLIHKSLIDELQRRDRGVKQKTIDAVLRNDDYAAVLVELLFITNAGDRAVLSHPDFPRRAAGAIFQGIESYFGGGETD